MGGSILSCSENDDDSQADGSADSLSGSDAGVTIRWLGHSCFSLTAQDGTTILTDPFMAGMGYSLPTVDPDVVTVSPAVSTDIVAFLVRDPGTVIG